MCVCVCGYSLFLDVCVVYCVCVSGMYAHCVYLYLCVCWCQFIDGVPPFANTSEHIKSSARHTHTHTQRKTIISLMSVRKDTGMLDHKQVTFTVSLPF